MPPRALINNLLLPAVLFLKHLFRGISESLGMSSPDGGFLAASPPPPGVTPDPVNGESIAYRLFIVAIFFSVLALVFLSARLFTAAFIQKKWHPDDSK
jgi:hypothetical protein